MRNRKTVRVEGLLGDQVAIESGNEAVYIGLVNGEVRRRLRSGLLAAGGPLDDQLMFTAMVSPDTAVEIAKLLIEKAAEARS